MVRLVALVAVAVPGVTFTVNGRLSLSVRLTWTPLKWLNRSPADTSPRPASSFGSWSPSQDVWPAPHKPLAGPPNQGPLARALPASSPPPTMSTATSPRDVSATAMGKRRFCTVVLLSALGLLSEHL